MDTCFDSSSVPELDELIEQVEEALADTLPAEAKVGPINVNTASVSELCLLPGIGPKLAARIVTYRGEHGRFERMEDLVRVPGIGEKKLALIAEMITLGK
jgi:competence ComEA-like helix-hairpin-helix protein